eukprot:gnl/MRDRNA2_/MRDRNA2_101491_c0_seq1.p1 gnl/MRDRNA2_/MRDRNA2_101491_c0~~gnl/MRDRNA2_/MRDRNA2_101491_c0_seq1.p1  ORF type:complete len:611 (-),score=112.54 gnl/MRDRNA2_/MRDRNA2_101491_c0_seq1:68-1900(-)
MHDEETLLVISWNVAGWRPTNVLVQQHYKSLARYLEKLGRPAIFCTQETKVRAKDFSNEQEAKELGAVLPGYRSFWSFNESKDPQVAHAGVATWVREDVPVLGATQQVLGIGEFDKQGRALLSDHGAFVVLNVYIQHLNVSENMAEGGSSECRNKLRFLEALESRMVELRNLGKRVLLCGDMNLTHRALDQKAERRLLWVNEEGNLTFSLPMKTYAMCSVGTHSEVVELTSTHAGGNKTNETESEAHVIRQAYGDKTDESCKDVQVAVSGSTAESQMAFDAVVPLSGSFMSQMAPLPEWAGKWVSVKDVSDRTKLAVEVIAAGGECIHIREGGCVPWLRRLVVGPQETNSNAASQCTKAPWADVFAEVHSQAKDRFTCWSSKANLRYINYGTRIDYVITDRKTFDDCVVHSPSSCLPGVSIKRCDPSGDVDSICSPNVDATSAQAAKNAATYFGAWHGSVVGEGLKLQADDMRLNNSQFPDEPATGLIYTPPSYSDHIPVSVLFKSKLLEPVVEQQHACVASKVETQRCQPWKVQRSISAFFTSTPQRNCIPAIRETPAKLNLELEQELEQQSESLVPKNLSQAVREASAQAVADCGPVVSKVRPNKRKR